MSSQELVTLNVGGKIFTTRFSTIKQFPASRLACMLDGRDQEFKMVGGQIFVDRDGVLFSFILDFLRTHQLLLPTDFSDYLRLQREALFYELRSLVDLLNQYLLQPRPALVEVHFLSRNTQAFFRVFGFCSKTIEMLTGRITVFTEQPSAPSYHDLVFQCGSDSSTDNQTGVRYFVLCSVSLEGFHLVSTRTVSSEDKTECYSFEKIKSPKALIMNETPKPETIIIPEQSQIKK
uniref:Potassium channel regulatory protein n=1 Tax=Macaca nemestrina TaxID=9545 RepID=A0A2K6BER6_MACNE